jgi:dihydroorotate dehydrogenase electron transfer subunit
VRGPYGNAFDLKDGKIALVGGGTGLVPLMRLAKSVKLSNDVTILMGSKSKDEVFFEDMANRILANNKHRVIVTTEDGSHGQKGFVTDILEKLVQSEKFDAIYTCGPEIMMYKIVQLANAKGIFVQASLERMMKCGIGICGSCCMDDVLVCHDGTIFDGTFLAHSKEFGHTHRSKSGIIENY